MGPITAQMRDGGRRIRVAAVTTVAITASYRLSTAGEISVDSRSHQSISTLPLIVT